MFHNIEQNTDEWLQLRSGKVTGSAIAKVMANFGKAFGEPAKKLAVDIAIEQITGKYISAGYSNDHMQRGHEEEPLARQMYEREYFCKVSHGGFYDNGDTGCSPDGMVGDKLIEIKSAIPSIHYNRIVKNSFDSAYKWQLLFNMRESGLSSIEFISYCSTFPIDKMLFVHTVRADEHREDMNKIDERLSEFLALITSIKANLS